VLQLKRIKKSYTTGDFTQTALDGVDLSFRRQEFVAILGPSGSGKTTSLNIIGGLDQYDKGDLIINGKSTKKFSSREWDAYRNNSVGFVFQSYNLIPHLSILDNVEMGMTLSGVSAKVKRKKALSTLENVGLKDHVHKKPTQLSGGQMQRVAIARALANDPDIILADEPTGALDTKTSRQIMDLIKEIAEDKLVIMVTHNPALAEEYADRIVEFQDGKVISDSNPYRVVLSNTNYAFKRTSMSFWTALKLSGKNIATKKWRTALTAFASSIGIIGIALIMSLSNGLQHHIDEFEETALIEMPIVVMPQAMDFSADFMEGMQEAQAELEARRFTDEETIYLFDPEEDSPIHRNIISQEFIDYLLDVDPAIAREIAIARATGMNLIRYVDGEVVSASLESGQIGMMALAGGGGSDVFLETLNPDSDSHLERNYDLLAGDWPSSHTDAVVVVDQFNRMNLSVLGGLGFDTEDLESISFEDIIGLELQLVANDDFYIQTYFGNFVPRPDLAEVYHQGDHQTITITGVFRLQEEVFNDFEILNPGIIYSDALLQEIIEREQDSAIVQAQIDSDYHVMTLEPITEEERDQLISFLGGDSDPVLVAITPQDFDGKDALLEYLDAFNEGRDDEYRIVYVDQAAMITNLLGGILTAVTNVLIGFAGISLVVSLIMIAIITYISVMERTKEIGILRALGARKKDITRVFNAETFIIGMCSGVLAITVSYLLTFPINDLIYSMTEMENVSDLNPIHATILLILSLTLTLLGGFIPARLAAKKDPVAALRAE